MRNSSSSFRDIRVTFICSDVNSDHEWQSIERAKEPLVRVENPFHALQLLADQGARYGWEVSRVIIDQDIAELGFLEFLARLPHGFRGDVLFIANERRAFLSAVGRHDDRVLYALTTSDLSFYLETTLFEPQAAAAVRQFELAC